MMKSPLAKTINLQGYLLVNKSAGATSFQLIQKLRRLTKIKKIGHAGTLDPMAKGLMILLIGRNYTRLSQKYTQYDKDYKATICLGSTTETYDREGEVITQSEKVPSLAEVENCLQNFQGEIMQVPPMYSAKKVEGKKLCDLARKGIVVERKPSKVKIETKLLSYAYPFLELAITCSSGTYVRSVAHDLGEMLTCGAYLYDLVRTRIGPFHLENSLPEENLDDNVISHVKVALPHDTIHRLS